MPAASSDLPENRPGKPMVFIWSCFGWGLHGSDCYQPDGSLLHCLSTLTGQKPAVYFCCTGLGVTSTGRYPASCPTKPGLSSPTKKWPRLFILLIQNRLYCIMKISSSQLFRNTHFCYCFSCKNTATGIRCLSAYIYFVGSFVNLLFAICII